MTRYNLPEGVPTAEVLQRLEAKKQSLILQAQKDRQDKQEIERRAFQIPLSLGEIEAQLETVRGLLEREQEKAKAEGDVAELHRRVDVLNASVRAAIDAYNSLLEIAELSPGHQVFSSLQPQKMPLALIKADGSRLLVCGYDRLQMEARSLRQQYDSSYIDSLIKTAPKKISSRG